MATSRLWRTWICQPCLPFRGFRSYWKESNWVRCVRRACIGILFHGSSFLSLEDHVDECQRFGLLGGASSASQAGKEQIRCIHPPFSLAACWVEQPSGKLCYGKLHNLKSSFSILIYNKHHCSFCTCTAATQMERALVLKIVRVIDLVWGVTASKIGFFKSFCHFYLSEEKILRKHN